MNKTSLSLKGLALAAVSLLGAASLATAFKGGGENRVPLARGFASPWAFAHDPIGAFLTFSSPTVKAVWSLES